MQLFLIFDLNWACGLVFANGGRQVAAEAARRGAAARRAAGCPYSCPYSCPHKYPHSVPTNIPTGVPTAVPWGHAWLLASTPHKGGPQVGTKPPSKV